MLYIKKLLFFFPISVLRFLYICKNITLWIISKKLREDIYRQIKRYSQEHDYYYLAKDVVQSYIFQLTMPYEYFLYGYEKLKNKDRRKFLTDIERTMYLNKYSGPEKFKFLSDKYQFSKMMQSHFNREVCFIADEKDRDSFKNFISKHKTFIAKPNKGSYGKNIRIYSIGINDSIDDIFNSFIGSGSAWVVEELIIQAAEMSKWNPTSVNTVRVPTFMTKQKEVKIYGTVLRVGRKGMIVDNAGAGGLVVLIDEMTGELSSFGANEYGEQYEYHPDSGIRFKGFTIPLWNELVSIAKQCHEQLPEHKYVGWDFALTDGGWVLIEGNWGQMLSQIPTRKGIKKEFTSLIKS